VASGAVLMFVGRRMFPANLDASVVFQEAPTRTDRSVAETIDVAQLVVAARGGDRAAFARLYERHARMVHGVLLARVAPADADDLVQDVFLLALRNLASLREPAAFPGWLLTIARNRANDFHRRPSAFDEVTEDAAQSSARAGEDCEAHAALDAIRSLPEAYRETLVLRLVEGMTGPEIAARTGLTEGSVRVNLHRGMKMLREKIAGSGRHE
jgi:RNA polymerase sigma-70 factor, ECF subfamily